MVINTTPGTSNPTKASDSTNEITSTKQSKSGGEGVNERSVSASGTAFSGKR
ncbi:hypothetical protein HSBAA_38150 [Vreelandella sulfidaeris]|uniref:Uncharacterized protein n=1 Tax=Vreelandella sulfidaeris TaxID=115553 RepID=A0A455UDU8_9GAMM|nr:hypothetical protein HSBAA_38150 [Halomonas sulfidaeris]